MVKTLRILAVAALLTGACGSEPTAAGGQPRDRTTPTAEQTGTTRTENGCPLTVPPQPGFVPPEPYPAEPPELYQSEWYGTADLWTMLAPEGEVWEGLPGHEGKFTQKILWWSDDLTSSEEPTPITLTGRRLDRQGSLDESRSEGASFREDLGDFMMTGVAIPAGCWELTARYGEANLSYVVQVKG